MNNGQGYVGLIMIRDEWVIFAYVINTRVCKYKYLYTQVEHQLACHPNIFREP